MAILNLIILLDVIIDIRNLIKLVNIFKLYLLIGVMSNDGKLLLNEIGIINVIPGVSQKIVSINLRKVNKYYNLDDVDHYVELLEIFSDLLASESISLCQFFNYSKSNFFIENKFNELSRWVPSQEFTQSNSILIKSDGENYIIKTLNFVSTELNDGIGDLYDNIVIDLN
jgi:hypothetical protein